jgi:hypothetical protein
VKVGSPGNYSCWYSPVCATIRCSTVSLKRPLSTSSSLKKDSYLSARKYFYVIDNKGQLYLSDCKHKNFISSLKDKVFLNMFFRLLRENELNESEKERKEGYHYLSPCGNELNYLKVDDPFACCVFGSFHSASASSSISSSVSSSSFVDRIKPIPASDLHGNYDLCIGGSDIKEPFSPSFLYVDSNNGRFYHELRSHRHLKGKLGLMQGLISQQLSQAIIPMIGNSGDDKKEKNDHVKTKEELADDYFIIKWEKKEYRIQEIRKWKERHNGKYQL